MSVSTGSTPDKVMQLITGGWAAAISDQRRSTASLTRSRTAAVKRFVGQFGVADRFSTVPDPPLAASKVRPTVAAA